MTNRSARLLLAALLAFPALLPAYTAIGGGKGLFRVQDAMVDDPGLNITLHLLGRRFRYAIPDAESATGYAADLVAPSLHYIPYSSRFFGAELFASWGGIFQSAKVYQFGTHDLRAGAKLSIPFLPVLKVGGSASYTFMFRDTAQFHFDPSCGLPLDPGRLDPLSWAGLVTLRFQDVASSAPNIMLNYGRAAGLDALGAGIELNAEWFAIFAEMQSLQPAGLNSPFDVNTAQLRLTPGVRIGASNTSALTIGYTFGWGPDVSNSINIGFNLATPFFRRLPPRIGAISGLVTNASTGAPLAATISFPDDPKLLPVQTDPNTGVFMVKNLKEGDVTVKADAEGYMSSSLPVHIEAGTTRTYEFPLRPLVTYGVIAGGVTDAAGQPLKARAEFPGSDLTAVESDQTSGAFRLDQVPVGAYTITVSADGYFPVTQTVSVTENGVATPNFVLNPTTVKSVITGQLTDRGTGAPLAGKVTFKDPTTGAVVAEVSAEPSTGVYVANLAVGTYAATAQVETYIDQSAAVSAEKDKTTKQDFALVKPGTTVTLKNIYFDFNKATIRLPQSQEALDGAAKILRDNPTIRVEIQGHTDNIGSDEYNQKLSEKRAWAVVNHLVQNYGIAAVRLTAVGYGEARPVATNETDEGRQLNRRVEFVVLGEMQQQ